MKHTYERFVEVGRMISKQVAPAPFNHHFYFVFSRERRRIVRYDMSGGNQAACLMAGRSAKAPALT